MLPDFVDVHRRALSSVSLLTQTELDAVVAKFNVLHRLPVDQWKSHGVHVSRGSLFVFQPTSDLLTFFSMQEGGRFLVEDVVSRELVETISSSLHEQPAAKK